MAPPRPPPGARVHGPGFTLVEALLVVTLLGILVSLALPAYQGQVVRAHRTQAMVRLMDMASCQERVRATTGAYDATRCLAPADSRYRFAYDPAAEERGFLIVAQPMGAQASDPCGALGLDALGVRTAGADPVRCWASR